MKATITYLLSALMGLVAASPAATPTEPCPREKCFNAKNECGVVYGGCWDECGTVPTFTVPLCVSPSTVSATASITASFGNATEPLITPSPQFTDASNCPMVMCVDKMTMCGNETVVYGGCYDTCGTKTPTAPLCTKAPVTITSTPTKSTDKPKKTKAPCTASKSWMCAPPGW